MQTGRHGRLEYALPVGSGSEYEYVKIEMYEYVLDLQATMRRQLWSISNGFAHVLPGEITGRLSFSVPVCTLPMDLMKPDDGYVQAFLHMDTLTGGTTKEVSITPLNFSFIFNYSATNVVQRGTISFEVVLHDQSEYLISEDLTHPDAVCEVRSCEILPLIDDVEIANVFEANLSFGYDKQSFIHGKDSVIGRTVKAIQPNRGSLHGDLRLDVHRTGVFLTEFVPTLNQLYQIKLPINASEEWELIWCRYMGASNLRVSPQTGQILSETWNFALTSLDNDLSPGLFKIPNGEYLYV